MKELLPCRVWRQINNYESYDVSTDGLVKNRITGVIRKGIINPKTGYMSVILFKNGKYKSFYVHRLVAETFIPNPFQFHEINHIDGDRTNNIITNIEWVNHLTNMRKRVYGKCICCYSKDLVLLKIYNSITEAANDINNTRFETAKTHISRCCRGVNKSYKGLIWKYQ